VQEQKEVLRVELEASVRVWCDELGTTLRFRLTARSFARSLRIFQQPRLPTVSK
jgi:hypothetical protein